MVINSTKAVEVSIHAVLPLSNFCGVGAGVAAGAAVASAAAAGAAAGADSGVATTAEAAGISAGLSSAKTELANPNVPKSASRVIQCFMMFSL